MAGVYVPDRKKESALDTVLKGVAIARDIYGIYDKGEEREREAKKAEEQSKMNTAQISAHEATRDLAKGQLELAVNKSKETKPISPHWEKVVGPDGKPIPMDVANAKGPFSLWQEPKTGKEPKTRLIEHVDDNGDTVQEIVSDTVGAKYGGKKKPPSGGTYEERLAGLKGDARSRFDSASMGLNAVDQMSSALASGNNTFSVVGDNDFTKARRNFAEAIGRMQSGGAIGKDEAKTFLDMVPTMGDSDEMKASKLNDLAVEMGLRVKNLGFEPDEVRKVRKAMSESIPKFQPKAGDTAIAAPIPKTGIVEDGFEFLGGDPGLQENWRKK